MAEYRTIKSGLWTDDEWIAGLTVEERYFFLYLCTNPHASVAGIYPMLMRTMVFESQLDEQKITAILSKFRMDGKAFYDGKVMWVRRLREHQETKSVKVQARIQKDYESIPDCDIKRQYADAYSISQIPYPESQIPYPQTESDTDTDTDTDTETETETETESETCPPAPAQEKLSRISPQIIFAVDSLMPGRISPKIRDQIGFWLEGYGEDFMLEVLGDVRAQRPPPAKPMWAIEDAIDRKLKEAAHARSEQRGNQGSQRQNRSGKSEKTGSGTGGANGVDMQQYSDFLHGKN